MTRRQGNLGSFSTESGSSGNSGGTMNSTSPSMRSILRNDVGGLMAPRFGGTDMRKLVAALLVTVPIVWLAPANAQLFNHKSKTPAAQRVPELIVQAKADPDERKRAAAAEELREYDTKRYPAIVHVLADGARTDPNTGVRYEAISSLAKIRPVSQLGGQTLEWAAVHDVALKVRWEAKSSLMSYRWAGYHSAKNDPKTGNTAPGPVPGEPPLYDPRLADPKYDKTSTPAVTPNRTT